MEQKLIELISSLLRLKREAITDSLSMKETDVWDSLKHMELIVSIEETFGIELQVNEILAMQSVKEIKRVLTERGVMD
ncbi:acyl carrier protein [Fibrobacterota bacterium]